MAVAKLSFGGGRGALNLAPKGYCDIYFKKFNDYVIASKPLVLIRNIFLG